MPHNIDSLRFFPHAYDLLVRILLIAIQWIETSTDIDGIRGATLDEQVIALGRGWKPTRVWARAVEATLYFADQLMVPLRAGESLQLELADRTHASDHHVIEVCIRRHRSRPVHALYHHDGIAGVYPVALYQLYVMPAGARDILISGATGQLPPITTFYVPDMSRSDRLDTRSLQGMLTWCLRCAAPGMGMAEAELRHCGLGRPMAIRQAVACHLIQHRGIHEAAGVLGLRPQSATTYYGSLRSPDAVNTYRPLWRASRVHKKEGP